MATLMKFTQGSHAEALNILGESLHKKLQGDAKAHAIVYLNNPPSQSPERVCLDIVHTKLCREFRIAWNEYVASVEKARIDVRHLDAMKGVEHA